MSEKKQTAVKEIIDMCYTIIENSNDCTVIQTAKLIVFRCEDEFKELEKQQIIDTCKDVDNTDFWVKYESFEQYYNETFVKKFH